ncbi:hypothetical protein [Marinicellulosiphila megalodicopiae]|uniref:hypothetical protein n=1 Tax=Marinicellulosiphila megalodicopiae TaxID=2724896 RepID=UPI003BB0FD85
MKKQLFLALFLLSFLNSCVKRITPEIYEENGKFYSELNLVEGLKWDNICFKYHMSEGVSYLLNSEIVKSISLNEDYYFQEDYVENSIAKKCYNKGTVFEIVEEKRTTSSNKFLLKEK